MPMSEIASTKTACSVQARDDDVQSKLWFKTGPLDRTFCYRVIQLQLSTDSSDQGSMGDRDRSGGSSSWFELAIMANEKATKPLVRNGKRMSWRSHTNWTASKSCSRHFGIVFNRHGQLLNALEPGNVIAVYVCAQYTGWSNDAQEGRLVASVMDHDLFSPMSESWTLTNLEMSNIPGTIKDGLYTLTPTTECHLTGRSDRVASRTWFTTPTLDQTVINNISELVLYTTACAHNHGSSPQESSNNSWFDLAILESRDAHEPKVKDGRALVWRSHKVYREKCKYTHQEGIYFDRSHKMIQLLEVGNVIAVRVSARFSGSKVSCREGRLIIRIANEGPRPKRPPSPPHESWGRIVESDDNLAKALLTQSRKETSDSKHFEDKLLTGVIYLLKSPLRADHDHGMKERPLRLLSLDGGGVRGLSSLLILKKVLSKATGKKDTRPCEYFDMIAGTSTGGLIALMLGRLKMSIDSCIAAYKKLSSQIFSRRNLGWLLQKNGHKYSCSQLENAIREILRECKVDTNECMLDSTPDACKVFVVARRADDVHNSPATLFRTYVHPQFEDSFANVTIGQAARATTAAPTYFKGQAIEDRTYIDGAIGFNNPVLLLLGEARTYYGRGRPIGCLLSAGTGLQPDKHLGTSVLNLALDMINHVANTELAHQLATLLVDNDAYFRFNVLLPLTKKNGTKAMELDDFDGLDALEEATKIYLADASEKKRVAACAMRMSSMNKCAH